ncbi:MAG: hypothetical protein AB9891_15055 [Anaerolineaceae bacterium]
MPFLQSYYHLSKIFVFVTAADRDLSKTLIIKYTNRDKMFALSIQMKKTFLKKFLYPAAFLILCTLAYGLLIPWLGFYWDDWPYLFFSKTLGSTGFWQVFENDRPFLSLVYSIFVPLIGPNPLVWQIFGILSRWFTVLSLWWLLNLTWPENRRQNVWVAALFAVYPGFTQQWISVIYSQAYLLLCCFILSIAGMVYAQRNPRFFWPATGLSLLASALSLFSTEYFFGIELLRPLFLLVVLHQVGIGGWKTKIWKGALIWLPYLLLFLGFGIWRAFFFQSSNYDVTVLTELTSAPENTFISLLMNMVSNGFTGGWAAWNQTFGLPHSFDFSIRGTQLYWVVVFAAAILVFLFLIKTTTIKTQVEPNKRNFPNSWCWQAIMIGLAGLLVGSLPFWIASLPFTLVFQWDRFTLAMMIGSALFIAGLIDLFIHTSRQKVGLVSILIAMAVGFQFQASNTYKREWASMQDLFWQLSWRAPNLKPGTMILTHEFPFKYYSDNSLTAVLNWIYAPDDHSPKLPYILNYLSVRLKGAVPSLNPNVPIEQDYRALSFSGSTSDSLVVFFSYPGCLRMMDPIFTNSETLPKLPENIIAAIPLSDLSRIETDLGPAILPSNLFGLEPSGTWCYYFQKVDLARQIRDWQQAASLAEEARAQSLSPADPSEWMPFIETYAMTGKVDEALSLTEQVFGYNPLLGPGLCQIWQRVSTSESSVQGLAYPSGEVLSKLQCDPVPSFPQEQQ